MFLLSELAAIDAQAAARLPRRVIAAEGRIADARQDFHHAEDVAPFHLNHRELVARHVPLQRTGRRIDRRDLCRDRHGL